MIRKLRWALLITLLIALVFIAVSYHYVINTSQIDKMVREEIPVGSSKAQVVGFLQSKGMAVYDEGSRVVGQKSGLAENLIYRRDVSVTFEFDRTGKLSSYSVRAWLTGP